MVGSCLRRRVWYRDQCRCIHLNQPFLSSRPVTRIHTHTATLHFQRCDWWACIRPTDHLTTDCNISSGRSVMTFSYADTACQHGAIRTVSKGRTTHCTEHVSRGRRRSGPVVKWTDSGRFSLSLFVSRTGDVFKKFSFATARSVLQCMLRYLITCRKTCTVNAHSRTHKRRPKFTTDTFERGLLIVTMKETMS